MIVKRPARSVLANLMLLTVGVPLASVCGTVTAGEYEFGNGATVEYKLTTAYALAMRLRDPHRALIDGPVDPLQPQAVPPGQVVGFTHTGLPMTINTDDGNRNFRAGSLVNNRLSGLGEIKFRWEDYGAVVSGSAFYDTVYEKKNDNDSPETVNKLGPNDEFTKGARYYDGKRSRMLEAYAYADFHVLEDSVFSLRFGKQLVAYGESLFLPGISGAMAPNDATKAFVPGAEIKDILLPVYQAAVNLSVGLDLSISGFYQLDWKPTEVFPVGDLFSPADIVGPGATFAYGSINPAYGDGCPGLLGPLSPLCNAGGLGGPLLNAPRTINVQRISDIRPDDDGQFGGAVRYQVTPIANLGAYYLRYHSHNPTVQLNPGFAYVGSLPGGVPVTTEVINQPVPVTYQIRYFDDIEMIAGSFSTVLGKFNIGGDLIYRDGIDVQNQAIISGVLSPIFVRGKVYSAQASALFVDNPRLLWYDEVVLVSEAKYLYVGDRERIAAQPGINPVDDGKELFNDRKAWGYQMLLLLTGRNVVPGWDLKNSLAWAHAANGNPSTTGDFGPLFGENDRRLTISAGMQYLQNLEFSLGYNLFFGNPHKGIRGSIVKQNPVSDRDYVTFTVKYNL